MHIRSRCLAIIGATAVAAAAHADVFTYIASGDITRRVVQSTPFPAPISTVDVGDTFEIRVTIDTTAAPDSDPEPGSGEYVMPLGTYSAELRLGAATSTLAAGAPLSVFTVDNIFGLLDGVEFIVGDDTAGFFAPSEVDANTVFSTSAFNSDAIPTSISEPPLSTANFTYRSLLNFAGGRPSELGGVITSFQIIPAPGAAAPLAVIGLLAGVRRRR